MSRSVPATAARTPASAAAGWRPQQFSELASNDIVDPIVEPLWTGLRVVAFIEHGAVELRDLDGDGVDEFPEVAEELLAASRADTLLIDGYLTHQPLQDLAAVARRDSIEDPQAAPTAGQMWFGRLGRWRRRPAPTPPSATGRDPLPAEGDVAIVAVDLLWLDDESLLDVPLLERKRMLESVLGESHLVRRGIYVRLPIGTWLGSWRSMGFTRLAYKAANSRYVPGETNPHWALGDLPAR